MAFSLWSEAFDVGKAIPRRYTCDGEDTSPALSWSEAPEGTRAFALIVDDPDAPVGVFTHWVLFNLPTSTQGLPEGVSKMERLDSGALQGRNDFGRVGYGGPCPPPGHTHRYRFGLYALDAPLDLEPGATKQQVLDAMRGHVLGDAQLVGTYRR
ncbi:MAG: YbhB/YbcL family Raf kinase inhibitor-like protein [Dehalococcoidia bacterium]